MKVPRQISQSTLNDVEPIGGEQGMRMLGEMNELSEQQELLIAVEFQIKMDFRYSLGS